METSARSTRVVGDLFHRHVKRETLGRARPCAQTICSELPCQHVTDHTTATTREVELLISRLCGWAREHLDVRAVALVGSWASGAPGPDSDVDVVLLTDEPARFTEAEEWVDELGGFGPVSTQSWGAVTERRFALPSGLEVELGVGRPSWARVGPVDKGTRRVVTDGMRVLYDPDGLLTKLLAECQRPRPGGPSG
jgi:predicted nucleotidyltransferase